MVDTITVTDFDDGQIFQRDAATEDASITISGTYTDGPPTTVEARVVRDGASDVVVDWTVIDASPAAGVFSGTLTVPQGSFVENDEGVISGNGTFYNIEVRFSNDTGVTDEGINKWGVGIIVVHFGSSTAQLWSSNGTDLVGRSEAISVNCRYGGSSPWHAGWDTTPEFNGFLGFLNKLCGALGGIPVAILELGAGGTGVGADAEGDVWNDYSSATHYDRLLSAVTDLTGGDVEFIHMACGKSDAVQQVSEATHEAVLSGLIAQFRTDYTNKSTFDNIPFLITLQWRYNVSDGGGGYDEYFQNVRTAQQNTIAGLVDDVYYGAETFNLPMYDAIHLADGGLGAHAGRLSSSIGKLLGVLPQNKGPEIIGYEVISTTVLHVKIKHNGGTKIFPDSDVYGFWIEDDGTPVTFSTIASVNLIVITLDSAYTGVLTVHYIYGKLDNAGAEDNAAVLSLITDNRGFITESYKDIPAI